MTYEPMDERGVYVSEASTLLGRGSADGAGPAIPIALGTNLSMSNETLNATGGGITQLTGDVTAGPGTGSQAATIANDAVTNAKAGNMAQSTVKGRAVGAGTGDPTDLTATQATAVLDVVVGDSGAGGTKGLVPAPAAGDAAAGKFLKASGAWVAPAGSGDFVGPASAVDGNLVVFDGTTGKLGKDGGAPGGAATYKGAMVKKSVDQTTADYTAGAALSFDTEIYDTDGFHEGVTNPTRLTVPSGVTKVNITASVVVSALTADLWLSFVLMKNGSSSFDGAAALTSETGLGSGNLTLTAIGVPVSAGDYFQAFLQNQTDTSVTIVAARTYFTIQVVE